MNNPLRESVVTLTSLVIIFALGSACMQLEQQGSVKLTADQLPVCAQYDMSRGERIASAYDNHMMEHPEQIKSEILSLLAQTTKERGLEFDLRELAVSVAQELKAQAKYKEAVEMFQALISAEQKTDVSNISLVDSYNDLASAYISAMEYGKAEQTLRMSLKITEDFYGVQSFEAAQCWDKLANLQKVLKSYKSELELRQKAHDIRVIVYKGDSSYLIDSYFELADLAERTGDKTKAVSLYIQALKIADRFPSGSQARELRQKIRTLCKETPKK